MEQATDATRRTRLANERTELAWWRTGLAALAVALAVGRVVPELSDSSAHWPYLVVGVCFGIYGIAALAYGSWRRRSIERDLSAGHFPEAAGTVHTVIAAGGVLLGLLTVVLILVD